jgi:transcriptional regulator of heat shock response
MVSSQLNWEIQGEYLEIFKEFLSNRITNVKFCEILEEKLELNEELSNKLQCDIIHEKAANFTEFLDNLSTSCEVCDRNPESCKLPGHISESELRKEIEETYLQIQKFLEE